jgi:hypothetical protein
MMRAILLAISALLVAWPAQAATYTYNINFGNWWDQITGTVITDCNNCYLVPLDIVSWTFTAHYTGSHGEQYGTRTISSTMPNAQFKVLAMPSYPFVWPFTATPDALWWNTGWHYADGTSYQMKFDGSDPQICFCVYDYPNGSMLYLGQDTIQQENAYSFVYNGNEFGFTAPIGAFGIDTNLRLGTAEVIQTPLPSASVLFGTGLAGLGLLGWRRKKRAAALAD